MLSSRDTPFSNDGWALVIEDIRRLALLVGGGANDLNAGAIDATQEALNDLSSALNSHEVDPDAHAALLASYLLRSDYTAPATPTPVTGTVGRILSGTQVVTSGTSPDAITGYSALGTATLSGLNVSTGIFTAPSSGLYLATASTNPTFTFAGGAVSYQFGIEVNGSGSYAQEFGYYATPPGCTGFAGWPAGSISGIKLLSANDTLNVIFYNQGLDATIVAAHFSIAKLA